MAAINFPIHKTPFQLHNALYYYFYDLISQWNYIYIIHILHPIKHFTIPEPQKSENRQVLLWSETSIFQTLKL